MKTRENAFPFIIYHAFIISTSSCHIASYKGMTNKTGKTKIPCVIFQPLPPVGRGL